MSEISKKLPKPDPSRSGCPLATTLDVIGDKWTLLVMRDMMIGKRRYGEFQSSFEGIPTNILADRLKLLVHVGLVKKKAYQDKPPRYEYTLTEHGRALQPAMIEICKWGNAHIEDTWIPPDWFMAGKGPPNSES